MEDLFIYEDCVSGARRIELSTSVTAIMLSFRVLGIQTSPADQQNVYINPSIDTFISNVGISDKIKMDQYSFATVLKANKGEIEGWLSIWSESIIELERQNEQEQAGEKSSTVILAISIINAIAVAIQWVPLLAINDTKITSKLTLLTLSTSQGIRLASSEALLGLVSRHISSTQDCFRFDAILKPVFQFENGALGLEILARSWILNSQLVVSQSGINEIEYSIVKRLSQALCYLGENCVCHKSTLTTLPNFKEFLALLLEISVHPSVLIAMSPASFWNTLFKHPYLKTVF